MAFCQVCPHPNLCRVSVLDQVRVLPEWHSYGLRYIPEGDYGFWRDPETGECVGAYWNSGIPRVCILDRETPMCNFSYMAWCHDDYLIEKFTREYVASERMAIAKVKAPFLKCLAKFREDNNLREELRLKDGIKFEENVRNGLMTLSVAEFKIE